MRPRAAGCASAKGDFATAIAWMASSRFSQIALLCTHCLWTVHLADSHRVINKTLDHLGEVFLGDRLVGTRKDHLGLPRERPDNLRRISGKGGVANRVDTEHDCVRSKRSLAQKGMKLIQVCSPSGSGCFA